MEDARKRRVPDVDDVLVAPTVVGGQLWALVAEERAIGEVVWVLGRGLDAGRVGVEGFVKVCLSLTVCILVCGTGCFGDRTYANAWMCTANEKSSKREVFEESAD